MRIISTIKENTDKTLVWQDEKEQTWCTLIMQLDTDWNGLSPDSEVIESVTRHKFIYCRATTFKTERTNSYNFE